MSEPEADRSFAADYFDAVYRDNPDPWGFATRPYEAAKYDGTLAGSPGPPTGRPSRSAARSAS